MTKIEVLQRMKDRVEKAKQQLATSMRKKDIELCERTIQANQWHIDNANKWDC